MTSRELQEYILHGAAATLPTIDAEVTTVLDDMKAFGAPVGAVKRDLALYWLRQQRPRGFFARLRWAIRLWLEVRR